MSNYSLACVLQRYISSGFSVVFLTSAVLLCQAERQRRVRHPQSDPGSLDHFCTIHDARAQSRLTHFISTVKALHPHLSHDALAVQWTAFLGLRLPAAIKSVSRGVGHMNPAQRAARKRATPRESMPVWISCVRERVSVICCFLWLQLIRHFWAHFKGITESSLLL